jgi:putative membrane protein
MAKTSDQAFVQKASAAGLAEVQDAQRALKTSHRDDVKRTAQQLLSDHTAANSKLKSLADRKNMTVATTPASSPPGSGADFDAKYISSQIKAHEDAIALFREQSKSGTDNDLRAFATETLPTLEKHLSMLQSMNK